MWRMIGNEGNWVTRLQSSGNSGYQGSNRQRQLAVIVVAMSRLVAARCSFDQVFLKCIKTKSGHYGVPRLPNQENPRGFISYFDLIV